MRKLYRCRKDRFLLGICGGLAQYFEIDSTLFRVLMIVFWIFTGLIPLFLLYLLAGLLIPLEPGGMIHEGYRRLFRSKNDRKIAGICGGIGQLLKLDPTIIRLLLVFLCLITGILPFLVIYLIGWLIIPEQ